MYIFTKSNIHPFQFYHIVKKNFLNAFDLKYICSFFINKLCLRTKSNNKNILSSFRIIYFIPSNAYLHSRAVATFDAQSDLRQHFMGLSYRNHVKESKLLSLCLTFYRIALFHRVCFSYV